MILETSLEFSQGKEQEIGNNSTKIDYSQDILDVLSNPSKIEHELFKNIIQIRFDLALSLRKQSDKSDNLKKMLIKGFDWAFVNPDHCGDSRFLELKKTFGVKYIPGISVFKKRISKEFEKHYIGNSELSSIKEMTKEIIKEYKNIISFGEIINLYYECIFILKHESNRLLEVIESEVIESKPVDIGHESGYLEKIIYDIDSGDKLIKFLDGMLTYDKKICSFNINIYFKIIESFIKIPTSHKKYSYGRECFSYSAKDLLQIYNLILENINYNKEIKKALQAAISNISIKKLEYDMNHNTKIEETWIFMEEISNIIDFRNIIKNFLVNQFSQLGEINENNLKEVDSNKGIIFWKKIREGDKIIKNEVKEIVKEIINILRKNNKSRVVSYLNNNIINSPKKIKHIREVNKNQVINNINSSVALSQKTFERLGLSLSWDENLSRYKSGYLWISDNKEDKTLFKIRISDHILPDNCVRPAGVIHTIYSDDGKFFIGIGEAKNLYDWYKNMSKEEKEELRNQGQRDYDYY